ncbi:MAG: SelB C-terminal domain-containing protein, partial [Chloroflexi bacterium]|nr:SelB C-terminal domain-containing protein [Chloroflexota bacterium]
EGDEAFGRITLAAGVAAAPFDRFVLRDSGRQQTVAGGVVLDPHPTAGRLPPAGIERRIAQLTVRRAGGREGLLDAIVAEQGVATADDLVWLTGNAPSEQVLRGFAVSPAWLAGATESLTTALRTFHEENPLARGMSRDDARAAAKIEDPKVFSSLIEALEGRIAADGTLLRLASHRVTFSPDHQAARDRLVASIESAGLAPPPLSDLTAIHGAAMVAALVDGGEIVKVTSEIGFALAAYERAKTAIADVIDKEGPATASRMRDVLGTSRKYLIPLLEHLDAIGFTKRDGDVRVLGTPR